MSQDIERHIFSVIQQRQKNFLKVLVAGLTVAGLLLMLAIYAGWPAALALIPLALIGPFVVNVIMARCPRCARKLHKSPMGAFRPLTHCARCGLRN